MQGAAGGQEVPRNSGAVLPRLDPSLLYKVGLVPTSSVIPYALRILPRFLEFLDEKKASKKENEKIVRLYRNKQCLFPLSLD